VVEGPEHLRALMESEEAHVERFGIGLAPGIGDYLASDDVSPEFLAKQNDASEADPWTFGFAVGHVEENLVIGMAGFKGPPVDGMMESAYGIAPDFQGPGYATEAAGMLVDYAKENAELQVIRAHTLPERSASSRVLEEERICEDWGGGGSGGRNGLALGTEDLRDYQHGSAHCQATLRARLPRSDHRHSRPAYQSEEDPDFSTG
jgi:RimJ/RimL family protein N-acetyltransferase